jgi:glycosyltransferase involved in cell wall biosynthesis
MEITVCIPAHRPRIKNNILTRTLESVWKQTYPVAAISIAVDYNHDGAAITRNRSLAGATTDWVFFLDSDDILRPNCIHRLVAHQLASDADIVWPWFEVKGGKDPFPLHFGRQWDPDAPHSFPITTLVRRELAVQVGGFPDLPGEDMHFWLRMSAAGAKFAHLPERLWFWNHSSGNTMGRGDRW